MKKPKKLKNLKRLKNKCWKLFSLKTRLKETDKKGYGSCITCGANRHYTELQAGHFIDGRMNSILFDERGVHIQCPRCNIFLSGNKIAYYRFMEDRYGTEVIDELLLRSKQSKKFTISELLDMAKMLTLECSELMEGKNG